MQIWRRAPARGLYAPTTRWAARLIGASVGLALPVWALDPSQTIRGTVDLGSDPTGQPGAGDRLVIKLYHPGTGVELDAKYRILETSRCRSSSSPYRRST